MTHTLEMLLNDCAIIRATFETLDLFRQDDPIREEMIEIVTDARANLLRRCAELRDAIDNTGVPAGGVELPAPVDNAHIFLNFLPECAKADDFREMMLTLLLPGYPRRRIDACMKLNVFRSVAEVEAGEHEPDPLYRYELPAPLSISAVCTLNLHQLAVALFEDLLRSVENNANFTNQFVFDRNVFQKYIAILFACYATTDPPFYA